LADAEAKDLDIKFIWIPSHTVMSDTPDVLIRRAILVTSFIYFRIPYSDYFTKTFDSAFDDYLKGSSFTKGVRYIQHIYMKSKKL